MESLCSTRSKENQVNEVKHVQGIDCVHSTTAYKVLQRREGCLHNNDNGGGDDDNDNDDDEYDDDNDDDCPSPSPPLHAA